VRAAVRAVHEISAAGVAEELVLTVPAQRSDEIRPLVAAALAAGTGPEVLVVPTDDPAGLRPQPWLAVSPRGGSWHDGRATAVWTVDSPRGDDGLAPPSGGSVPS